MLSRPVLYPRVYPWLLLLAAMDVMLTWLILELGGSELNAIADRVIQAAGLPGMLALKFSTILVVVGICEVVGRRSERAGLGLAGTATAITSVPVVFSMFLIAEFAWVVVNQI